MTFTSVEFAVFIVILLFTYYILPKKYQWIYLLFGSYIFYAWAEPLFTVFLLFSTFTTWIFPLCIGKVDKSQQKYLNSDTGKVLSKEEKKHYKAKNENSKRHLLLICLFCNLGLLIFLKYTNFLIESFNIFGLQASTLDWLIMPLGISFYTFQSVGYSIDVYRGLVTPQKNFFRYALYVSFFPQICQGPIGRYLELSPQLYAEHDFEYDRFMMGLERLLLGLFKKLVVANRIALYVDTIYKAPTTYSGGILVLATLMYAFQLYADFSGYMDIAVGIGNCLGIRLTENFRTPYFSTSIAEYWRRWHITLGAWFRDYIYYPVLRSSWCTKLGKFFSKKGYKKGAKNVTTAVGLAITWILIGLWHGASWHYVFHGIYHGTFIILGAILGDFYQKTKSTLHIQEQSKLWHGFQIIRTFGIVCFGYVLFRSDSLTTAGQIYKRMFTNLIPIPGEGYFEGLFTNGFGKRAWLIVAFALLVCFVIELLSERKNIWTWFYKQKPVFKWLFLYCWVMAIIALGEFGATSFLYFQF